MNNNPKVSIIIPIYGVERFIRQCAESLLSQTYDNIEYIFVNDCTKDNSLEVLNDVIHKNPSRRESVRIINHPINRGLAWARHTGITNSTGEYIYHLDGDDWLDTNAIESLVKKTVSSNADMCVADFYISYDNKEFIQVAQIAPKTEYICNILQRNRKYAWTISNRLIKRSIHLKAMPIDDLNMGEDYATVPRLLHYSERIIHVDKPLYHYRQTNSASYTKALSKKSIEDLVRCISVLTEFFSSKKNSEVFLKSLEIGKIQIKYTVCLCSNSKTRQMISLVFPEIGTDNATTLSEKLIFWLSEHRMYKTMDFIVGAGMKIKKQLRLLTAKK